MSDISDSENAAFSESVDVTGREFSTSGTELSSSGGATGPRGRTPDQLSGISDIPSPGDKVYPSSREKTGAARLEEILRAGPSIAPDREFVEELGKASQAQSAPVVDLTAEEEAAERTASQASTSGRDDETASDSTDPSREDTEARDRASGKAMRINDVKVYRRADAEMTRLAGGRPVYTADYFTTVVTQRYLAVLRQDFRIPESVELLAPGVDDIPSRPPVASSPSLPNTSEQGCASPSTRFSGRR